MSRSQRSKRPPPSFAGLAAQLGALKPGKTDRQLRKLLAAAAAHGEESGIEYEVGDLQDILEACWARLSPEQRREVLAEVEALRGGDR